MGPIFPVDGGTAQIHFPPALDFFLPLDLRGRPLTMRFRGSPALKNQIEALGIPHPEVGRVTVNHQPCTLMYRLHDGDQIQVYAWTLADSASNEEPRFLLDNHLGRLTAYLRMLGMDALYPNPCDDVTLAALAAEQGRVLLSRDRRLLMRKVIVHGYCPRSLEPREQIFEVVDHYNLTERIRPFQRCLSCNTLLQLVAKSEVDDRLESLTRRYYDEFHRCPACGQVYWKGSHYEHMLELVDRLMTSKGQHS